MAQNELLSTAEAVERLNIDRSTLTRWVAGGRIEPAMKLPGLRGAYLFDPAEVERVRGESRAAAAS
jgi:excisionase family DNA binding protein